MRRFIFFSVAALAGCGGSEPRPAQPAPPVVVVPPAPDAAPPATASAREDAGAPALAPTKVDLSLSVPDYAQVIAAAADGAALLAVHGWTEGPAPRAFVRTTGGGTVRSSTEYTAVLDAKHECIEETVATPTLDAAAGTGTVAEALGILKTDAAKNEIADLRRLARRFKTNAAGPVVFGPGELDYVVEANNELYFPNAAGGIDQVPVGVAARITPSPAGTHIAFARCGSPCGGAYAPAVLDFKTRKVKEYRVGDAHDFHFTPDGKTLYFSYDDAPSGLVPAKKACVGRIDVEAQRFSNVKCFTSEVHSTDISVASPSANFVALQTEGKGAARAFHVLEVPSGKEAFRVDASPIWPDLDDSGRAVWDDNDTPAFHFRVRLVSASGEQTFPEARSVGFLADGSVLVQPKEKPSDFQEPIRTLREQRCGFFKVWKPSR